MKDIQGIQRGECNKCECEEYRCPPPEKSTGKSVRLRCEYCDHTPVDHVKIISLGACKQCTDCENYESEEPNKYTDCQYCGCGAQYHAGAEKLIKKSVATSQFTSSPAQTGMTVRTDPSGNPVQTSQFGLCKCHGCQFPRRVEENGHVHDFCSRTCARKYEEKMQSANFPQWPAATGTSSGGGNQMLKSNTTFVSAAASGIASTAQLLPNVCTVCKSNPPNRGYDWCERCYSMAKSQKQKR